MQIAMLPEKMDHIYVGYDQRIVMKCSNQDYQKRKAKKYQKYFYHV